MKKLICALVLIQSGFMMAQKETLVTVNGKKVQANMNAFTGADNGLTVTDQKVQLGGTLLEATTIVTSPTATLALKGLQAGANTDKFLVADAGGILKWVTPSSIVAANQVQADWNETDPTKLSYIKNRASIPIVPNIVPTDVGTLMAIDGQLVVAQEITSQMKANYVNTTYGTINSIGNINDVIIDNKNKFISSATTNSFTVDANGVYLINMNVQVLTATIGNAPNQPIAIGVVDKTTGAWVTRLADAYMDASNLQTFTLLISVDMLASHTYSFAISTSASATVYATSTGASGTGAVSFYSVKRLK